MATRASKSKAKAGAKLSKEKKSKTKIDKKQPSKRGSSPTLDECQPSAKETANGEKVLSILENIDEIGYTVHRPDLFTVQEPEFGLDIAVDAEEDVICLIAEICDRTHLEDNVESWPVKLLELNNSLLHGAFTLHGEKVLLRENLAAENLDANELEEALSAMFMAILRTGHILKLL